MLYHKQILFTLYIIKHELSFPSTRLQITKSNHLVYNNGNKNYKAWNEGTAMHSCNETQKSLDVQLNFMIQTAQWF